MLKERGIQRGIEVLVQTNHESEEEYRKARVVRTYPPPSTWLVVQYEDGNMEEVDGSQITTMFEANRRRIL
jgi:hypothetical protein